MKQDIETKEYIDSLRGCTFFTKDELDELLKDKKKNRNTIVTSFLPLAYKTVLDMNIKENIPDWVQECTFYLMQAVDNYDPSKGTGFITYATCYLKNGIRKKMRLDTLPKRGRGIPDISLNAPVGDENGAILEDIIEDTNISVEDEIVERDEYERQKDILECCMAVLTEEEKKIISMRNAECWTFERMGKELGMTKQGAYKAYNAIIRKMKEVAHSFQDI